MDIAISLIRQNNIYLLQQREFAAEKGAAGLIGCFGGKLEAGEEAVEAVCREINEETSLQTAVADFIRIGRVDVVADRNLQPVDIRAEVFVIELEPTIDVAAKDGRLVKLSKQKAQEMLGRLTPATRATFEQFVLKGGAYGTEHY